MLDKSVPYFPIAMKRCAGLPIPSFPLPKGYSFAKFKPGDDLAWTEIETSAGEFENADIAFRAALICIRYKLPMADSFIYATGQLHEALIWTQDAYFKGLPGVKYIEARTAGGKLTKKG